MAVTRGTQGDSATPASTFYTNVLAPALTAAGWTLLDSPTQAQTSSTSTLDTKVWRSNQTPEVILAVERDDLNTRILLRAAEAYNAATHKLIRPIHGGVAGTAYTPSADYSVPGGVGTEYTINTATTVGLAIINMSAGGFGWLLEVRANLITLATRTSGLIYPTIIGYCTSLVDTVTDSAPLFMVVSPNSKNWTADTSSTQLKNCSSSREPNTTTSVIGNFSYVVNFPINSAMQGIPNSSAATWMGGYNSNAIHFYLRGFAVGPAVIHGTSGGGAAQNRQFRAYIPDVIIFINVTEAGLGDAIIVDGDTYYYLGRFTDTASGGAMTGLAIKA